MQLIDIGVNLTHDSFDHDRTAVLERAAQAGVAQMIVTGSTGASTRAALELAYIQRRDYRQAAADLGVTADEARRRLRLGLQLLSTAGSPLEGSAPPGYGRIL